jgi:hypothetical protein
MSDASPFGFLVLFVFVVLLLVFALWGRRWPVSLRSLRGYEVLGKALESAVESGERVHLSLGTGTLIGLESAPAFVGFSVLSKLASATAMSDQPVIVTTSDGALTILAQDTLSSTYRKMDAASRYLPTSSRMLGPSPFSYAAAIPTLLDTEEVSVHILSGAFGSEGALVADFGRRKKAFVLAGTDDVQSQALFYAIADQPLIGEEVFAGGAYLNVSQIHHASLRAEDVLRYLILGSILIGTLLKTFGVLH